MNKLIAILTFMFALQLNAKELDQKFQIIPKPQQIDIYSTSGVIWSKVGYIISQDNSYPVMGDMMSKLPRTTVKSKIGVELILDENFDCNSDEGYILEVSKNSILIKARSNSGLFYGCATLEQLLNDSYNFNIAIPLMKITDYPDINYRAIHIDVKHHLDRMEYYYSLIDKLASYKINAVIWELEDKLYYSSNPKISSPNAMSPQEMQTLSKYAKERNVEISPLIQGLGHAGFILKHHWELRESENSDWEFCPSNPDTYTLQFGLYSDALDALPDGKYLHVGGDEITAIGICDRCKATGKSAFELQMEWLKKVCDFAVAHDRIPIFWDDMPLKYGGVYNLSDETMDEGWKNNKLDQAKELFPEKCIYMRWNYGDPTQPNHLKTLEWYKDAGLKVMAATAASEGGSPFMPRDNSLSNNIRMFSKLVSESNLEGILATSWDDGSPHLETVIRGYIAQGEYGWNPTGRSVEEYKVAHAQREFGFTSGELEFLDDLENFAYFFDGALVDEGRRCPSWQVREHKLIALPDRENLGNWSQKYSELIEKSKHALEMYESIKERVVIAKQHAIGSRYTLDIYEQNNELFSYPARLILSLNKYDSSSLADREEAKNEILNVIKGFDTMRSDLEQVYSKTRFMSQPKGYISDHNHHKHLSALTMNSDWLYLYELDMNRAILKWL